MRTLTRQSKMQTSNAPLQRVHKETATIEHNPLPKTISETRNSPLIPSSEPVAYVYESLSANEFRLLELSPGLYSEPLVAKIIHAPLFADAQSHLRTPYYEALSYVWGSAARTQPISIQSDSCLHIGHNLELALRRLRFNSRSR